MLVLRRKAGEAIVLNGVITIHVLAVEGERVKLGISAPPEVVIVRSELLEGQGGMPTATPTLQPPVLRDAPRPFREPSGGEPASGYESGRGARHDANGATRGSLRTGSPDSGPLPFRPNSVRYGQ
jgi:carbon storage regulator